jgi:hypothetical protein
MSGAREPGAGEPTDDDYVAALLTVMALMRQDGDKPAAPGNASAISPLGRWRAQRMAALARTLPDADGVRLARPWA